MHCRRGGIKVLPYLDDFMSMKSDFGQCVMLARRVERDSVRAWLNIIMPKCCPVFSKQRRQLGFNLNFEAGKFQVPGDWSEELKASIEGISSSRHGRVQAHSLASVTGTVLSMHLSWGIEACAIYGGHMRR